MGSVSMQSQGGSRGERLSAVVDGEWFGESDSASGLLSEFDSADRAMWSEYHLIGDVLRSDELAIKPAASHAFLAGFAARLEAEPHVLAPAAPSWRSPAQLLRRRIVPVFAVAAAVATLSWVIVPQMQHMDGTSGAMQTAAVGRQDNVQTVAAVGTPAQQPDVNIIRDASLDQYLEAHQQFAQQPMVAVSMPLARAAALTSPGR